MPFCNVFIDRDLKNGLQFTSFHDRVKNAGRFASAC